MASYPQHVYVMTQKDFNHYSDDADVITNTIGVCLTLEAANQVAKRCAREQYKAAKYSGDPGPIEATFNSFGGYIGECQTSEDDRDHFVIEVDRQTLLDAKKPDNKPPKPWMGKHGPMYTIPKGKPNGLRGAKFICAELETMDLECAKAAIEIYGGRYVNSLKNADYCIFGRRVGHDDVYDEILNQVAREDRCTICTEDAFHELLKNGVPADVTLREVDREAEKPYVCDYDSKEEEEEEECEYLDADEEEEEHPETPAAKRMKY